MLAIEQGLPMESKATIIYKLFRLYAEWRFDLCNPNVPDALGILNTEEIRELEHEKRARIQLYTDKRQIDTPGSIGEYERERCEYGLFVLRQESWNDVYFEKFVNGDFGLTESFDV